MTLAFGRWLSLGLGVASLGFFVACGGQTASPDGEDGGGGSDPAAKGGSSNNPGKGGASSGKGGNSSSKGGSSSGKGGASGGHTQGGSGGLPDFTDPGCPNPPAPLEDYACDPYGSFGGCDFDEACYPYVSYPSTPCGQEIYGAQCVPQGQGQQGENCSAGCAKNHICVVTGEGTQCVQLCKLNEATPCPSGLVCGAVDIPGIGGCI